MSFCCSSFRLRRLAQSSVFVRTVLHGMVAAGFGKNLPGVRALFEAHCAFT